MQNTETVHEGLLKTVLLRFGLAAPVLALMIFVPAGTLAYWEGWLYMAIILIPMTFMLIYLAKHDPDLLERRMHTREREGAQSRIMSVASVFLLLAMILPGLDHRFGWSHVPVGVVLFAALMVLLGYGLVGLVFRENSYASRVVEVMAGQQVISSGPYAHVRHPMYSGVLLMYLFTPLALGSYWAILFALPLIPIMVARLRNEESVLVRDLPGYAAYMQQTRYRLIPRVW